MAISHWYFPDEDWTNNSVFQCLDAVLFTQEEEKTGHGKEDEQSGPPSRSQDSAGPSQCVEGQEAFFFVLDIAFVFFRIINYCHSHSKQFVSDGENLVACA